MRKVIESIEFFRQQDTNYAYIPSRYGTNSALDAAADMFVCMQDYIKSPTQHLLVKLYHQHGEALSRFRLSLGVSEEAYMTCALFVLFDIIIGKQQIGESKHSDFLQQILAQLDPNQGTDFRQAAFYDNRYWFFFNPNTDNAMSPCDNGHWEDVVWASQIARPKMEAQLLQASTQLFVRLPRLMAYVRSIRNGTAQDLEQVTNLACELHALENDKAEHQLLKNIKVSATSDTLDRKFVRLSYEFKTFLQWEAAILYWIARLILIRLCQTLTVWSPSTESRLRPFTLRSGQLTMARNIFMSWQYARAQSNFPFMGKRIMKEAATIAWGALSDMETWDGMPVGALAEWVVWRLRDSDTKIDTKDMRAYLDSLSGGPIHGLQHMRRLAFDKFEVDTLESG